MGDAREIGQKGGTNLGIDFRCGEEVQVEGQRQQLWRLGVEAMGHPLAGFSKQAPRSIRPHLAGLHCMLCKSS